MHSTPNLVNKEVYKVLDHQEKLTHHQSIETQEIPTIKKNSI